ncbi:9127_t:CDS:2, partial [Ambispora gerdemannii]
NLRHACHQFALEQIQIQREQLKKIGLFTDYQKYYLTLDKEYKAEQIRVFGSKIPLLEKWQGKKIKVEKIFLGEKLLGLTYFHPYQKGAKGYVVDGSDFIEEKEGTGIVHLAPAFGAEDFAMAKKEKLIIDCPLGPNGLFNEKIGVSEIVNKHYSEVNKYVVADLEKRNLIVKKEIITHSYPHD